jgi:mRNA interferase MazF
LGLKRGEVWWARLKPPAGRRPVVLLSRDEAYPVRTAVTVAPLTTTVRGIAVEVSLGTEDGLPKPCVVNCDSLLTIPKAYLESRITRLSERRIGEIHKAIRFALDIERLK